MRGGQKHKRPVYGEQPTIVIALAERGEVIGAHTEGFEIPGNVRLVVRDFSLGVVADEDGLLYEDREILPGDASTGGRVDAV